MQQFIRVIKTYSLYLSIGIALLFHFSGYLGMQSEHRDWFIAMTPFTLLLMTVLVVLNEKNADSRFWWFAALAAITGFGTELIGVNTGMLFGDYAYGTAMGIKWLGVPLLIGIQWFTTVYGAAQATVWIYNRFGFEENNSMQLKTGMVITGAAITTWFDWILEPAAIQLGYWSWIPDGVIPVFNYVCWFVISALILLPYFLVKKTLRISNVFAIQLLVIEAIFFILLGK
jgi:putative membrane protein